MEYQSVLSFWFIEIESAKWWKKDEAFDRLLKDRFGAIHNAAVRCELFDWRAKPEGRLAEIIVLDQFSRNIYRNSAQAFASDSLALGLAQEAIRQKADLAVPEQQRFFFYMPYMHSESPIIHNMAVKLFSNPGMAANLDSALKHKAIIDRFGRYPHRNSLLGRESTPEEKTFLKQPGSSF